MPLLTDFPHSADIYALSTGRDDGGGTTNVYTLVMSSVPCRENQTGSSTRELFGQMAIVASGTITFRTSFLSTPIVRGMKIETGGRVYLVTGITKSQGQGTIPSITRAICEDQL